MRRDDPYAALRIKEFNVFLVVRFLLVFGWSMQFIVIEWQVYSITKDPLSLGIIGLMEIIPAFTMALFAGHIVDQREKRNLLAVCTAAFSLISLGLFLLTTQNVVENWSVDAVLYAIYGLVFFGGFLRSFFGPTIFSLVALLVPKNIYHNAAIWSTSTWKSAAVSGALFGGFFISWIGVDKTLCVVFILVILSFIILFQIQRKPVLNKKIGEPMKESLQAGVKFVIQNKAILGSILTMFITTYIPINKKTGKKMLISVFVFGLSIIAFGLSSIYWVSVLALFVSGAADGISMVIRQTILQIKTPDEMRGRVSSVNSMFVGSSNELGAFESGLAAKIAGPVTAVVFGGIMTIITTIVSGALNPTLRNLDLSKETKGN